MHNVCITNSHIIEEACFSEDDAASTRSKTPAYYFISWKIKKMSIHKLAFF